MAANRVRRGGALATLMLLGAAVCQSANAVPAWTLDNVSAFRNGPWSFGEIFTVGSGDISVTALGAFDANLNGFVTQGGIEVGIFRETDDVLLTSAFVMSSDNLSGNYRFVDISPLTLLANTQYRVVATNDDDLYNVFGPPDNVDSRITWDGYGYCSSTTLTSCDNNTGTEITWVANFKLEDAAPVPEPATLLLLGLGLAGLGVARRRRLSS